METLPVLVEGPREVWGTCRAGPAPPMHMTGWCSHLVDQAQCGSQGVSLRWLAALPLFPTLFLALWFSNIFVRVHRFENIYFRGAHVPWCGAEFGGQLV